MSLQTSWNRSSTPSKALVIGHGEVGMAMQQILNCEWIDFEEESPADQYDILHICFPYTKDFVHQVRLYQQKYAPKFTVIHSTVPIGTCANLSAIHAPIRGIHPNLEQGIRTFKMFLGGKQASLVADYFRRTGLTVILVDKSETTEAGKLFDTEYYRACIEFAHRVKSYCDRHNLNFHEVYTLFNQTYNDGYTELGHKEFVRPVLQPIMTKIGGHCVLPNKELLDD